MWHWEEHSQFASSIICVEKFIRNQIRSSLLRIFGVQQVIIIMIIKHIYEDNFIPPQTNKLGFSPKHLSWALFPLRNPVFIITGPTKQGHNITHHIFQHKIDVFGLVKLWTWSFYLLDHVNTFNRGFKKISSVLTNTRTKKQPK